MQQQTQQSQQQILTLTTTLDQTKTQAITTKSKIDAIDTTQLNTFKNEQVQLTSSAESILQELPRDPYHTYISTHPSPYIYKKNDPLDFIRLIDESLTQGKLLRQQEKHIQEQITQIDKEEVTRSMRNKELEEHVQYSKKNKESQTMFHCEKIQ